MTRYVPGRASVLIPCFNASRYLREAIESALAQTYGDVEIVVCDDGSRDDSATIARRTGRVHCLQQANAGPSAARNRALAAATGEYVALLEPTTIPRTKIKRQLAVLAERPEIGAVYCGWRSRRRGGRPLPEQGWPRVEGDLLPRPLLGNLFHPGSVVIRRTLVDAAGGFDCAVR